MKIKDIRLLVRVADDNLNIPFIPAGNMLFRLNFN